MRYEELIPGDVLFKASELDVWMLIEKEFDAMDGRWNLLWLHCYHGGHETNLAYWSEKEGRNPISNVWMVIAREP